MSSQLLLLYRGTTTPGNVTSGFSVKTLSTVGAPFISVDSANGTIIAVSNGGIITRSVDGGATFSTVLSGGGQQWRTVTSYIGTLFPNRWAAYGANGAQAISTDDGVTWTTKTITGSPEGRESRVLQNLWTVVGSQGYYNTSTNGDMGTASFAFPSTAYPNTGIMLDNLDNIILTSSLNQNLYYFQRTNPSTNGFVDLGKGNTLHGWSNGTICAVTHVDGSITRFMNVGGTMFNTFIPSAILTAGVSSGQKLPVRIWFNTARSEWVIMGNNQGAPAPLLVTTTDFITFTDRTVGIAELSKVGSISDVTWDSVNAQYVFAANATNSMVDGNILLFWKP